jgi:hypothetical protein
VGLGPVQEFAGRVRNGGGDANGREKFRAGMSSDAQARTRAGWCARPSAFARFRAGQILLERPAGFDING